MTTILENRINTYNAKYDVVKNIQNAGDFE